MPKLPEKLEDETLYLRRACFANREQEQPRLSLLVFYEAR